MTSKIKVDNINKVSDDTTIIKKCGSTTTVGSGSGNTIVVCGSTVTIGRCGGTVALASGATQTGFGSAGQIIDWQTASIKTATFTAVNGQGFFANTSAGAFTMNLPAGSAGAIVAVADYANTWDINNLTISPNGSDKIGGTNANVTLDTVGQSVTFVFVDSTQGWINVQDSTSNERASNFITATGGTLTTCGNDKIHTFTGPGTFAVSALAQCAANNVLSHLVIAGGGGGGYGCGGGGGGAGGFREVKSPVTPYTASPLDGYACAPNRTTATVTSFPITIGAGGSAGTGPTSSSAQGGAGANSVFSTITSAGGGGGGGNPPAGVNGGSGGGGGHNGGPGGSGNTPPVSPAQGQAGAASAPVLGPAPSDAGGGGGGATAAASGGSINHTGGAGATTSINGTPTTFAGGGGGTNRCGGTSSDTAGGSGGGGRGGFGPRPAPIPEKTGVAGTANTGGGGGGGTASSPGTNQPGAAGGSGIVVIRYKFQ
tara:strand:+ start:1365 stop:2819 length:1455 start_codon:yes stop_codon:yes gene_type:complete